MDQLKEALQNIWLKIVGALKNFEDSPIFERIMRRYESLSPSGQSVFKGLTKIFALMIIAFMILGGPFMLLSKLNDIQTLEALEGEATTYQAEYEAQTKGFTPPVGWRPLAGNSADSIAAAFNEYLPGIGVPEEFGTLVASGETLKLILKEISIRQATNIIFQLEGLYPKVQTQTLKIRPNAGQRDIIDVDATFKFNPAFANQISGALPSGNQDLDSPEEGFAPPPPPSPPPSSRNTPNLPSNSGASNDDSNEYIPPPPPPPPGGDYEEFAPPELPDDLPPPPPPPGFEEEL